MGKRRPHLAALLPPGINGVFGDGVSVPVEVLVPEPPDDAAPVVPRRALRNVADQPRSSLRKVVRAAHEGLAAIALHAHDYRSMMILLNPGLPRADATLRWMRCAGTHAEYED